MRNIFKLSFLLVLFVSIAPLGLSSPAGAQSGSENNARSPVKEAYLNRYSNLFLQAQGDVVRILKDDEKGTPHQRFIIMTSEGQTVLIVHNLNLSTRVPVRVGLEVRVYGEYEWNPKGGLIHNTHRSTGQNNPHGWIEIVRTGKRYE